MLQKLEGAQVEQMLLGPRRPFWKIDPYSRDLFDNCSIHPYKPSGIIVTNLQ